MTRREIIAYTSSLTGAALAAPLLSSLLVGCKESAISDTTQDTLHFFSSEEFSLIQKIVDTILPQTDSPSATQVGVDYMIDSMVGQVYNMEDKTTYRSNFDQLKASLSNVSDQD